VAALGADELGEFGAEELGGAVALTEDPEFELDIAELDTDDAEDDGVNDANERLVGVDAAAQNCSTRASAETTSEGQALRQERKVAV